MNKLLLSAAACALLTPLGACAKETSKTEAAQTESSSQTETRLAAADPDKDKAYKDKDKAAAAEMKTETAGVVYMPAASLSAKELIGEGVEGQNGDEIATIEDIVIGADGRADRVVFTSGEFLGLGGKKGAIDYRAVDIAVDRENEPDVSVSMSEEGIKAVAEFVNEEINDYSLASELLGAQVDLQPGGDATEDVVINDIIFDADGKVEHLIVQKSAIASIGAGDKYAVAYNDLQVEQGDGGLLLAMTETELDAAPKFEMSRKGAEEAWEDTKDDLRDAADDMKDAADEAGDDIEDAVD